MKAPTEQEEKKRAETSPYVPMSSGYPLTLIVWLMQLMNPATNFAECPSPIVRRDTITSQSCLGASSSRYNQMNQVVDTFSPSRGETHGSMSTTERGPRKAMPARQRRQPRRHSVFELNPDWTIFPIIGLVAA